MRRSGIRRAQRRPQCREGKTPGECDIFRNRSLRSHATFLAFCLSAAAIVSGGCVTTRAITYDITKVSPGRPVDRTKTLNIRVLHDARRQHPQNAILFEGDKETEYRGKTVCVNSENYYDPGTVPLQITALIAEHFRQRRTFKTVVHGVNNWADYTLVGTLSAFYVRQDYDYGAAVGSALGGLAGAIVTATNSTETTEIRVAFTGLQVFDRMGNRVGRPADVVIYEIGEEKSDPGCWEVYNVANYHLYLAIRKLVDFAEWSIGSARGGW